MLTPKQYVCQMSEVRFHRGVERDFRSAAEQLGMKIAVSVLSDAIAVIRVPHGGSDDAWEDPTHLRAYFPGSFGYFSQPFYSNADYGYRADWNPEKLTLLVYRSLCAGLTPQEIISKSQVERNVVKEMICEMRAVKPMRGHRRELQTRGKIEILPVD